MSRSLTILPYLAEAVWSWEMPVTYSVLYTTHFGFPSHFAFRSHFVWPSNFFAFTITYTDATTL